MCKPPAERPKRRAVTKILRPEWGFLTAWGRNEAPGNQGSAPAPGVPVVEVCQWCQCIQPQHLASAPGHRMACHQRWRCASGAWALSPGHHQRRADRGPPGQHLACPCIQPQHLASAGQITATSTPAPQHLACPWWRCGRVVPVHPTPAPGERPQHQGRADRGHQASAWRARAVKVCQIVGNQARTWRASGGGVPVHPTPAPGERRADHCHQHPSAPAPGVPVVEVWARGASASNASAWRAATAPGPGRSRAPGHQASA